MNIKNMKKQALCLLCLMTIISVVQVVSAEMVFKANTPIDLKVSCENNGSLCSTSAACNLTIIFQNGSVILTQQDMTNSGAYFNYTVPFSEVGTYRATMNCFDKGLGGVSNFEYEVTPTGDTRNWILFLFLGMISLVVIVIAFLSGNEYIMFVGSALLIVTGVYGTIYGIGNVYNVYTRMVSLSLIGLGSLLFLVSSLKAISESSGEDSVGGFGSGGGDEYDYFNN